MATILGLILTFALGGGLGAWATYDWLRYHGMLTTAQQRAELFTHHAINQILDGYGQTTGDTKPPVRVLSGTKQPESDGDEAA